MRQGSSRVTSIKWVRSVLAWIYIPKRYIQLKLWIAVWLGGSFQKMQIKHSCPFGTSYINLTQGIKHFLLNLHRGYPSVALGNIGFTSFLIIFWAVWSSTWKQCSPDGMIHGECLWTCNNWFFCFWLTDGSRYIQQMQGSIRMNLQFIYLINTSQVFSLPSSLFCSPPSPSSTTREISVSFAAKCFTVFIS